MTSPKMEALRMRLTQKGVVAALLIHSEAKRDWSTQWDLIAETHPNDPITAPMIRSTLRGLVADGEVLRRENRNEPLYRLA